MIDDEPGAASASEDSTQKNRSADAEVHSPKHDGDQALLHWEEVIAQEAEAANTGGSAACNRLGKILCILSSVILCLPPTHRHAQPQIEHRLEIWF